MKVKILLIVGGLLLGMSHTALWATSLCNIDETNFFSCKTRNGKTLSLCGVITDRLDENWLQYRFGSPAALELSYPSQKSNSFLNFKAEQVMAASGSIRLDALVFVSGGIGYSVESITDRNIVLQGVSVGDPEDFSIKNRSKRRKQYPKARILCAERVDTYGLLYLIKYLIEPQYLKVKDPRLSLDTAVKEGIIRKATPADADAWLNAFRKKWARLNLPPPAIDQSTSILNSEIDRSYVVLKEFIYPKGLENENRAIFFIPEGVPNPSGSVGHYSEVYDFATLSLTYSPPNGGITRLKWPDSQ